MGAAKILIVEDEPNMVAGLRDNFEYEGFQVLTALDGVEGLERALLQTPVYNGSPARLPSGSPHVQRLHTLIAAARQRFGPAAAGYER